MQLTVTVIFMLQLCYNLSLEISARELGWTLELKVESWLHILLMNCSESGELKEREKCSTVVSRIFRGYLKVPWRDALPHGSSHWLNPFCGGEECTFEEKVVLQRRYALLYYRNKAVVMFLSFYSTVWIYVNVYKL